MENKEKARFFAQYYGQKVYRVEGKEGTCYLGGFGLSNPELSHLLLKPLSSITDEDAILVTDIILGMNVINRYATPWKVTRDFAITGWPYIKVHHPKNIYSLNIDCNLCVFDLYNMEDSCTSEHDMKWCNVIDFLRSRGYALPYLNYSVQDLQDMNWIKLQTEK